MASTATKLLEAHATTSGEPDRAPDQIDPEGVELKTGSDRAESHPMGSGASTRVESSPPSPLSVFVDELQQYVVQDVIGAVYGVAAQPEAAFEDYFRALTERFTFLRSRQGQLSPRLARQLEQLESLFPGR
jgi:hypothetical protein